MTDFALYLTFIITTLFAITYFFKTKKSINSSSNKQRSKNQYLLLVLMFALLSGLAIFPLIVWAFNLVGLSSTYGHGEVLFAAPIFNFLFGLVLAVVGRIALDWEPIKR